MPKEIYREETVESIGSVLSRNTSHGNIQVHHLIYERLGRELFSDLIVVCDECHETLHAFISKMVRRGFSRDKVVSRVASRCVRRLVAVHEIYRTEYRNEKDF